MIFSIFSEVRVLTLNVKEVIMKGKEKKIEMKHFCLNLAEKCYNIGFASHASFVKPSVLFLFLINYSLISNYLLFFLFNSA